MLPSTLNALHGRGSHRPLRSSELLPLSASSWYVPRRSWVPHDFIGHRSGNYLQLPASRIQSAVTLFALTSRQSGTVASRLHGITLYQGRRPLPPIAQRPLRSLKGATPPETSYRCFVILRRLNRLSDRCQIGRTMGATALLHLRAEVTDHPGHECSLSLVPLRN